MRSERADVARTFLNRLTVVAIGTAISVMLARSLGPDGRGQYAVAVTFASTALAVGHLSLEQALVGAWIDRSRRSAIAGAAVQVGAVVAPVATIISIVVVPIVVERDAVGLSRLAAVGIIPMMFVLYINAIAVAAGDVRLVNRARLLSAALQLILVSILLAASAMTVTAVIWVWLAVPSVQLAVLWGGRTWRSEPQVSASRSLVRIGLGYHLGSIATQLLRRVDILILARYEDAVRVGHYALAVTIAELLFLVSDSLGQVTQPSQLVGTSNEATRRTARLTRITVIVASFSGIGLISISWFIVPGVYGTEFEGTVGPLVILVIGVVALATLKPISILLVRLQRPWLVTAMNVAALVVNVAANITLIPRLGANGAAIASSVAYLFQATLYWLAAQRLTGLALSELLPRRADVRAVLQVRSRAVGGRRDETTEPVAPRDQ